MSILRCLELAVKRVLIAILGPNAPRAIRRVAIRVGLSLFRRKRSVASPEMILALPGRHVFFGYYDKTPFSQDGSKLLAASVPAGQGAEGASCDVGLFDLGSGEFRTLAKGAVWNWQQGCRLQWHPAREDWVIYNDAEHGSAVSRLLNVATGRIETTHGVPVYDVDSHGRLAVSLDFARLHRHRPGYGYPIPGGASLADPCPKNDGVWILDLETGEARLGISLLELAGVRPRPEMENSIHYVNHLSFNPSGSRFLFLHLWLDSAGRRWTRLVTSDAEGESIRALTNDGIVSHYCWLSETSILVTWLREGFGMRYYSIADSANPLVEPFEHERLRKDGHPSPSPDGRSLITDTYPDSAGDQHLLWIHPGECVQEIGRYYSPLRFRGEVRCDLHPRWDRTGRRICFDAVRSGRRALHVVQLPKPRAEAGSVERDHRP